MVTKFKVVIVPPDEVHIVSSGKGQFIHTSQRNPKYWLTPWKNVYKITTAPITIHIPGVNIIDSTGTSIMLEMETVVRLRDPELAVKSVGGDIESLKRTLEKLIRTTTRQVSFKYPMEPNIGSFQSALVQETRMSVQGLTQMLGFDVISCDIINIHKRMGVSDTVPQQIPDNGNGYKEENLPMTNPEQEMPPPMIMPELHGVRQSQIDGDNGSDIGTPTNLPMLPAPAQEGMVPSTPAYIQPGAGASFPEVSPESVLDYYDQFTESDPQANFLAETMEDEKKKMDWHYNQMRNSQLAAAFDNFQYSRDDLKFEGSEEGNGFQLEPGSPQQQGELPSQEGGGGQPMEGYSAQASGGGYSVEGSVEASDPIPEPDHNEGLTPTAGDNEPRDSTGEADSESGEEREKENEKEIWDDDEFLSSVPEEKYRTKAENVIREIKGIISRIRRKGMVLPPNPINTYLANITNDIENGRYLDATKLGRECLTYLEETEQLFEEVRDEVIQLQDRISVLKTRKVSIDDIEEEFTEVIDLFKNAEYIPAKQKAAVCRDLLNRKKSLFEEADTAIQEAWQLMKNAAPMGWDVSRARILLDEAKKAEEEEQYELALERAKLAQDVIQAHFDSLKGIWLKIREIGDVATKAHEDSLSEIQTRLDKFGEKMDEILTLGVKITPAINEGLSEVEDALSRYDIYEAKQLIEDLETTISELKDLHERAQLKFERASLRIEETKRSTKDIRPMNYLLGVMEDALKAGDYELVSDISDEVTELCDSRENADHMMKALETIESSGRIAEECKELGMDVIDVNPLLRDSVVSFRQENFQRANSKSELAYKILLEAKGRYLVISTRRIIETSGEELTGPKEKQLEALEEIEWILDRGEPETAMERLRKMRINIFEKKFLERLRNAEGKLRWLEDKNVEVDEERKLVIRAKLSFDEQDFKIATKIINKAIEELDAADQYERIIEELENAVELIGELEAKGMDVSAVKNKIITYKPIINGDLEAKSYVTAMGYVQECLQMALDLKKGFELKSKIGEIEKKLSKLEMEGISSPSIWRLIQKAYKALSDNDIRKAASLVERVLSRMEEEVLLFKKDKALKLRELKKNAVKLFKDGNYKGALKYFNKALKIQPRDEKLLYNKAVILKNLERGVEAIQYCNRALAINEDYEQADKLRESCRRDLRDKGKVEGRYLEPAKAYEYAPLRYSPQEDVGMDFMGIRNLISEIVADLKDQGDVEFADFSLDEIPEGTSTMEKTSPLIEMMARDLLFNTKKLIEENPGDIEAPIEDIMEDLQRINILLEKGNLAVIIRELLKIRGLIIEKPSDDEILGTWKKIMDTRRKKPGVDDDNGGDEKGAPTNILVRTKPHYEEGDLRRAIDIMKTTRMDVASQGHIEVSDKISLGLQELNDLIGELEDSGVDMQEVTDEIALLKPAIELKFYKRAVSYIERALEVGIDLRAECGSGDLDFRAQKIIDVIESDLKNMG